jgi:hypothetical protein
VLVVVGLGSVLGFAAGLGFGLGLGFGFGFGFGAVVAGFGAGFGAGLETAVEPDEPDVVLDDPVPELDDPDDPVEVEGVEEGAGLGSGFGAGFGFGFGVGFGVGVVETGAGSGCGSSARAGEASAMHPSATNVAHATANRARRYAELPPRPVIPSSPRRTSPTAVASQCSGGFPRGDPLAGFPLRSVRESASRSLPERLVVACTELDPTVGSGDPPGRVGGSRRPAGDVGGRE